MHALRRGELGEVKTSQNVPVLVVTAVSDIGVIRELVAHDAVRIVGKPSDTKDLMSEAQRLMGRQGNA